MPVTVFCSIIDQSGGGFGGSLVQVFIGVLLLHLISALLSFVLVKVLRAPGGGPRGVDFYLCIFQ